MGNKKENQEVLMDRESIVTMNDALAAYNTLRLYCNIQDECEKCLFALVDSTYGKCILEQKEIPRDWQELEI